MPECLAAAGGVKPRRSFAYPASLVIVFAYDITGMESALSDIIATIPIGKADNVGRRRRIRCAGRKIIGFPNPVNEKAARTVAGGVLLLCSITLVLSLTLGDQSLWLTVPIALGFVARVLTGPRLSPLGQVATRLVAPRLGTPKLVPGPPKRFAQGIGSVVTTAAVGVLALGLPMATQALLGLMIVAAGLESIFAFCVGCRIFAGLMRLGVIPPETCEACNDVSFALPRQRQTSTR